MIWSLVKAVIFIAIAIAVAFGISFIIETPGGVSIAIAGHEKKLDTIDFVLAILLLLAAFWVLLKLTGLLIAVLKFLSGDETAITRYWGQRRERRGFEALAEGMIALASGESNTAVIKAAKAEKLLKRPELTRLIAAQANEMDGNKEEALRHYKALLEDDRTRFVAIQGIMKQKLAEGDTDTALKLAQKAFALRPYHNGNLDTLFDLQAKSEDWNGARKTLNAKLKSKTLPSDVVKRRDAVLLLADALEAFEANDTETAQLAATQSNKLAPTLVPAAVLLSRLLLASGNTRRASRTILNAWKEAPHPDLVTAFASLMPDESLEERRVRFEKLIKLHPDHSETKLFQAELALAEEDFPAARRYVKDLVEEEPTTRSLAIMAAAEKGAGADETTVRAFLAKALGASRGPQWVCSGCGHVHEYWLPVCEKCQAFDSLSWTEAAEVQNDAPIDAVLPLIIGSSVEEEPDAEIVQYIDESLAEDDDK